MFPRSPPAQPPGRGWAGLLLSQPGLGAATKQGLSPASSEQRERKLFLRQELFWG